MEKETEKRKRTSIMSESWEHLLPDSELDVCEENLEMFWYWIYERHRIWRKRFLKKQPAPWTKDPILRDHKFTNAYRELDRNSIWLIEKVIKKDYPDLESKLFAMLICRLFNKPETFEIVGYPDYHKFNPKLFRMKVEKMIINKGGNPFTDAYLINSAAFPGQRKYISYCENISKEIHDSIPALLEVIQTAEKPEQIIKELVKLHGIANFISYEIYCDLDYTDDLMNQFDQNSFVNVGPGALTGVRMIFPNKGMKWKDAEEMIYHLTEKQEYYFEKFGFNFKPLANKYGRLTLREVEHSLCEYQKYFKMKHKVGKQRQKFQERKWDKNNTPTF